MAVKVQSLRSATASKRPTTVALLDGEIALNTNTGTPGLFFEDSAGVIVKVGPAEVGSSAPNAAPASGGSAGNSAGEFWFDTANAGPSGNGEDALKVYNGTAWSYIGKVTIGSTNVELGAAATTSLAGLTSVTSAGFNATSDIDLENQADLRFYEATANGSNYVGFQAPATISADVLWTLPATDGNANQVLTTDGLGTLSWTEANTNAIQEGNSSVTVTDTGANGNIAFATEGATRWNINNSGHLVPGADSTYNIGASGDEVSNIFVDTLTSQVSAIFNGDVDLGNATSDSITFTGRVDSDINPLTNNAHKLGSTGLVWSEVHGTSLYGSVQEITVLKSLVTDVGTATATAQSITISGGTGLTSTASGTSITINLDNTTVVAASYGSASKTLTATVDAQGRLTALADTNISITASQVSDFNTAVQANRLDQMAAPTASVSLNNQLITNLATPLADTDAANKGYVDAIAQGIHVHTAVKYATTAALPAFTYSNGTLGVGATITANANGALSIDGFNPAVTNRVLIKDETAGNAPYNGVYVVTAAGDGSNPFVLTRATDLDQASEFPGAFEFVTDGSTNADSGWICTTDAPITVGTTPITFAQFSGAGQVVAGDGLSKTGNTLDVNVDSRATGTKTTAIVSDEVRIDASWTGQNTLTTLGTVTTGTWNANIIGLAYGGTGVNNTTTLQNYAFLGPNTGGPGNATFREILTSDVAPITGGSWDAGTY
jgi:hypothetical protein